MWISGKIIGMLWCAYVDSFFHQKLSHFHWVQYICVLYPFKILEPLLILCLIKWIIFYHINIWLLIWNFRLSKTACTWISQIRNSFPISWSLSSKGYFTSVSKICLWFQSEFHFVYCLFLFLSVMINLLKRLFN